MQAITMPQRKFYACYRAKKIICPQIITSIDFLTAYFTQVEEFSQQENYTFRNNYNE